MSEVLLTVCISAGVSLAVAALTWGAARERLRREFMLDFAAENAVKSLLKRPEWKCRTFEAIKRRLGGFDDDELRKLLVRSGAIRAFRSNDQAELWGLASRNPDLLQND